jgi:hypothetical protein
MADPIQDGALVGIRETMRIIDADPHAMDLYETRDGQRSRTMLLEYSRAR